MFRRIVIAFTAASAAASGAMLPVTAAGTACANLAALTIPDVTVRSAALVAAGTVHAARRSNRADAACVLPRRSDRAADE